MKPLNVLITDDEPIARDILKAYVSRMDSLQLVGECANAVEAYEFLKDNNVDILLLDINMPEVSGLDLLRKLPEPPATILTTAYSEFAVESYELNVTDYLLKPFSFQRFATAIGKVAEQSSSQPSTTTDAHEDTFFVKSEGKLVKVNINELLYVEGVKDYVKLCTSDKQILVHSTMKNMEGQLSAYSGIVRVHKSYLINMQHIQEVEGNMIHLQEHTVLIGNTYKDNFFRLFDKYRLI